MEASGWQQPAAPSAQQLPAFTGMLQAGAGPLPQWPGDLDLFSLYQGFRLEQPAAVPSQCHNRYAAPLALTPAPADAPQQGGASTSSAGVLPPATSVVCRSSLLDPCVDIAKKNCVVTFLLRSCCRCCCGSTPATWAAFKERRGAGSRKTQT